MKVHDAFPAGAVTGADFVTGQYEVGPGERVVNLDVDLDALPAWGLLCVHESTVKLMMTALGWDYEPAMAAKVKEQRVEIERLRKVNKQMRDALIAVVEAASAAGIVIVPEAVA
jgi:hypothetical protein